MGGRDQTKQGSSSLLKPISVLDTHARDPGRSVERLRDVYSASTYFAADFPTESFQSRIENWSLPGLALTKQVSDANKIFLTGGKGFSVPDLIYVRINFEGSNRGIFGDRSYVAHPGDISIIRSTDVGITDFTRRNTIVAYLPRVDVLERPNAPLPDLISRHTPSARLMGSVFRELSDALPKTATQDAGDLAEGFVKVIRALLGAPQADLSREDFAQARYRAVVRYINENAWRLGLNAGVICQHFGISRASLYRMFRDVNGVDRFILERRLCRAFEDIAAAKRQRGMIRLVAEKWGFLDASKFSHQFRQLFDMSPSDALGSHIRQPADSIRKQESVQRSALDRTLSALEG